MSWLDPDRWWSFIEPKIDRGRAWPLLVAIAVGGGFVMACATEIGVRHFNTDWHEVAGYSAQPNRSWGPFAALWIVASQVTR